MKKKILCLSLAAVMSLGMATSAFARVGSGDVNSDGNLTAEDSAMTVSYTHLLYRGNSHSYFKPLFRK